MLGFGMQEYECEVLEQYDIEVTGTRKTRGAILCDTDQGLLLLREVKGSDKRIPVLCELYDFLFEQGYEKLDRILPTREGGYVAKGMDGTGYILKRWFQGRECDVRKPGEVLAAAGNLAKLHMLMQNPIISGEIQRKWQLPEECRRHNRELKKVRKFVRAAVAKSGFEYAFLNCFDQMYEWAQTGAARLEDPRYESLFRHCVEMGSIAHGEYNYHNVLMIQNDHNKREGYGIATTNFEKIQVDIQAEDLYYFLRKVMEKHSWKIRLGDSIINTYSAIRPLEDAELDYVCARLIYPEKFWKTADSYYRSNKAWVSVKNTEKLEIAIRQTEEKKQFLQEIFSFHL